MLIKYQVKNKKYLFIKKGNLQNKRSNRVLKNTYFKWNEIKVELELDRVVWLIKIFKHLKNLQN